MKNWIYYLLIAVVMAIAKRYHFIYILAGIMLIASALWMSYSLVRGRVSPNGSLAAGLGLIFWLFGTGFWFVLIQFDIHSKLALPLIIAVQAISIFWIVPIMVYRKMKKG